MKKIILGIAIAIAATIGLVTAPVGAISSTVVVTSADLDAGPTATAVTNGSGKWFMYNDTTDVIDNTLGSFVNGPAIPFFGTGSIQFTLDATNTRKAIATFKFSGTSLASITQMSYGAYSHSGVAGADESPYLNFNVDFSGSNPAFQRRLVYVPSINGAVPQDTWNNNDVIQGGAAKWVYSGPTWPLPNAVPGTTPKTWTQILTDYPAARLLPVGGWLGIKVGEPGPTNYVANVDFFSITTGGNTTTFDFDAGPTIPTITTPANGATVTTSAFVKVDWIDSTGSNPTFQYRYEAFSDAGYTGLIYDSGMTLSASEILTPGTPPGVYYVRVKAQDAIGTLSGWSNGSSDPYKITVITDPINAFDVPAQCDQSIVYHVINGNAKSETINGTNGNDLIYGNGGSDKINGKNGNDCIVAGNGSDVIHGDNGDDVILGGNGSDSIFGDNGSDTIYGEGGSDVMKGGNQSDFLYGGDGSDSAKGENGQDTCVAESKNSCEL